METGQFKFYRDGDSFLLENKALLATNEKLAVFFFWDAPLLKYADRINYALRYTDGEHTLLVTKVEPYNMLLFGDEICVPPVFDHLIANGYEIKNLLCRTEIGCAVIDHMKTAYGIEYFEALAMDFMEVNEVTEPSDPAVETAVPEDLDEICECLERFIADCGLLDKVNREKTAQTIDEFRLIREDGRIAAMAKFTPDSADSMKLSDVYTRDEFRGRHYARRVVNTVKNEIISRGKTATLNVDRRNPVSYHLYPSLGFTRSFSQGEFRRA